jgi:hypothetical protein
MDSSLQIIIMMNSFISFYCIIEIEVKHVKKFAFGVKH